MVKKAGPTKRYKEKKLQLAQLLYAETPYETIARKLKTSKRTIVSWVKWFYEEQEPITSKKLTNMKDNFVKLGLSDLEMMRTELKSIIENPAQDYDREGNAKSADQIKIRAIAAFTKIMDTKTDVLRIAGAVEPEKKSFEISSGETDYDKFIDSYDKARKEEKKKK